MVSRPTHRPRRVSPYPLKSIAGLGILQSHVHTAPTSKPRTASRIFSHIASPFRPSAPYHEQNTPIEKNTRLSGPQSQSPDEEPLWAVTYDPGTYTRKPPPTRDGHLIFTNSSNINKPLVENQPPGTCNHTKPEALGPGPLFSELLLPAYKRLDDSKIVIPHVSASTSPPLSREIRARSTSSEYPSPNATPRAQSPASPPGMHRLSLSDLSEFGKDNHDLSRPSSGRTSVSSQSANADASTQAAIKDATAAITEWQEERSNSSREEQRETHEHSIPNSSHREGAFVVGNLPEHATVHTPDMEYQLDGAADSERQKSPGVSFLKEPLHPSPDEMLHKPGKRRASQFSLRSITDSFHKRPRLGLHKLASSVYEQGTKRIRRARQQWRQQAEHERREFQAWRARRRRDRPADVLKGRPEGSFGTFCLERSRFEHEPWWREGVSRYKAPSWMLFPKDSRECWEQKQ